MRRAIAGLLVSILVTACRGSAPPEPSASASQAPTSAPVLAPPSAPATVAVVDAAPPAPTDAGVEAAAPPPPRVLVKALRVISIEDGKILARRPIGGGPALVLGVAPTDTESKITATATPFLKKASLLDVAVSEFSEHGWHHQSRETHYIVDMSVAADSLACVFTGAQRSGGEYASESTSADVKAALGNPKAFDVTRTTTSRASQPKGAATSTAPTTMVEHFELGAPSCAPTPP